MIRHRRLSQFLMLLLLNNSLQSTLNTFLKSMRSLCKGRRRTISRLYCVHSRGTLGTVVWSLLWM